MLAFPLDAENASFILPESKVQYINFFFRALCFFHVMSKKKSLPNPKVFSPVFAYGRFILTFMIHF